jgi:hypothetical protein
MECSFRCDRSRPEGKPHICQEKEHGRIDGVVASLWQSVLPKVMSLMMVILTTFLTTVEHVMDDTKYSIDLRTNNGLWARVASWFVGGRLVTPEQGRKLALYLPAACWATPR